MFIRLGKNRREKQYDLAKFHDISPLKNRRLNYEPVFEKLVYRGFIFVASKICAGTPRFASLYLDLLKIPSRSFRSLLFLLIFYSRQHANRVQ